MPRVLLTGGSGFIAAHTLDQLLERGFDVVTTVRSEEKGDKILAAHPNTPKEKLSYVIVKDIAQDGAFDEAVKSNPPFDYVLHTASPFHFNVQDPVKDFLDPAIKGTTGILKAIKANAPNVKRVVITSSFAAIVNGKKHAKVYSEENWNPVTWAEGLNSANTYRASKTFAEKAAWDFIENENPNFDIATINPPLVLGPVVHYLTSLDAINTSNARISNLVRGQNKESLPPTGVFLWVDVRDVALAHIRAIEVPDAGAKRYFVTAGYYTNKDILDIIRDAYPELGDRLPPKDSPSDLPKDVYGFDNSRSVQLLGIKYRSMKESVVDTVKTLLSPTANLLRKSRLFALPQALDPFENPTTRMHADSDSATLPHPIRASVVTPASSLSRGDWGLKRPLPAKSTSLKSSRPVVRINELDTFEHVTDFDSAADHTVTLEKFQELHMPISLPAKVNYSSSIIPPHQSPFEKNFDNIALGHTGNDPDAKQFRHTGPWLGGLTEAEFVSYLKKVQKDKPELMQKLRGRFFEKRAAEKRKQAQDNGEDLDNLPSVTEQEFQTYLKALRADPFSLGPVVFELLDLPSAPMVPNDRISKSYYQSPPTKMPAIEYAALGPPTTHPSAGLSYTRTHTALYNHPKFGPLTHRRPVEARILRPRGRFNGKVGKAIAGVGGIAIEDVHAMSFADPRAPAGMNQFDGSITGGAKYHVSPVRASINTTGRISLSSYRASDASKAAFGIQEKEPTTFRKLSYDVMRSSQRSVPRLDRARPFPPPAGDTVKRSAKVVIERYYPKLTLDFETNKRVCDEIAIIPSKRLRNKVSLVQLDSI
ncbi:mitochondrial 37S ribosomal protein bS1m [Aspergillus undulatus]|uniref:mitochondrial 37S ribosomal protein bS1m n=1 Tax=Aspergillus undulatus TaxID=1810928 RepID=UPI003CCDC9A5